MAKTKIHLVVVGGGFAGIKVIRELANNPLFEITLISDHEDFRYCPALYRTATGHQRKESSVPLAFLLEDVANLTLVKAKVAKLNREHRMLKTHDGQTFRYDYCVLALGMVTSYFGIPGIDEFAYGIKSAQEVDHLKAHLHRELIDEHALDKNYVVVGAGATGVELSAALRAYLTRIAKQHHLRRNKVNIELIEAADRVLPASSKRSSRIVQRRLRRLGVKVLTGKKVEAETANTLVVDGRSIPTHTVIWTAGVTNNPFFPDNADQFSFNDKHKVVVNDHLQADDHLFVIGDNAATLFSGLALTAIHNASYVARALRRYAHHKTLPAYHPLRPITVVPVGPRWAVVQWGNLTLGGWLGGVIRLFADLIGYMDVMGIRKALAIWLKRNEYEETCPTCHALIPHST